jgi:hypothetical protein
MKRIMARIQCPVPRLDPPGSNPSARCIVSTVDAFEPKLLLRDGADFVAVFTIRFGDHVIDGMDHMHLNDAGLVDSMTVAWRPLPAVVAVQQKLALKLGATR